MAQFIASTLVIVFTVLLNLGVNADNHCFYFGNHQGTKCFDPASGQNLCCPADRRCESGKCVPFRATPPPKSMPVSTSVLIGITVSLVALAGVMFGAIYWHRRQMQSAAKQSNLSASFSQSTRTSTRTSSSAGFRGRSCIAQPSSNEASVSIERSTTLTV